MQEIKQTLFQRYTMHAIRKQWQERGKETIVKKGFTEMTVGPIQAEKCVSKAQKQQDRAPCDGGVGSV